MYRVCYTKGKSNITQCSIQCYGILASEPVALNLRLNGYKTTLEPCSSLLPEFLDLIRCEKNAQKYFDKK